MTTPAAAPTAPRCPVCRASLRGHRTCARCGADLGDWCATIAAAWRLRRHGWQRLFAGDAAAARAAADRSAALVASPSAMRLRWLADLLARRE